MQPYPVIVIGAGASGMMAAIRSAERTKGVVLLEKNDSPGKKLRISGKGRCNITNSAELDDFVRHFGKNGNFLRSAFGVFFRDGLLGFLEKRGLSFKTERGGRIFPESDSADSVVAVLQEALARCGVSVRTHKAVTQVLIRPDGIKDIVLSDGSRLCCHALILATGGLSYPLTGSTGDGYRFAQELGHSVVKPLPGLVPLETKEPWIKNLSGLSLKNVRLKLITQKKTIESDVGEMLFAHFGISGPLVLDVSGAAVDLLLRHKTITASIDLKPGLTDEQLHKRLMRDIASGGSLMYKTMLKELLPQNFIPVFIEVTAIDGNKRLNQITQQERGRIIAALKDFRLTVVRPRPVREAIITRGGVSTREVNPKTMESRLYRGLYMCGEVLDIDADTGGYNLQAAFSTGYLAGESAARSLTQ